MSMIRPGHHEGGSAGPEPLLPPPPHCFDRAGAEFRSGASYAATHGGWLPVDQYWRYEEYRHDLAPGRFDAQHHRLAPLLDREAALRHGQDLAHAPNELLPNDSYWNYLRYRHDLDPHRFDHYHPHRGKRLNVDERYRRTHGTPGAIGSANGNDRGVLGIAAEYLGNPPTEIGPVPVPGSQNSHSQNPPPHGGGGNPSVVPTPEPASMFLMAAGLILSLGRQVWNRRRTRPIGPSPAGR
jgi:hypothetical protein